MPDPRCDGVQSSLFSPILHALVRDGANLSMSADRLTDRNRYHIQPGGTTDLTDQRCDFWPLWGGLSLPDCLCHGDCQGDTRVAVLAGLAPALRWFIHHGALHDRAIRSHPGSLGAGSDNGAGSGGDGARPVDSDPGIRSVDLCVFRTRRRGGDRGLPCGG